MIRHSWSIAVPQITNNQSAIELDTVPPQFQWLKLKLSGYTTSSGIAKWRKMCLWHAVCEKCLSHIGPSKTQQMLQMATNVMIFFLTFNAHLLFSYVGCSCKDVIVEEWGLGMSGLPVLGVNGVWRSDLFYVCHSVELKRATGFICPSKNLWHRWQ